MTKYGVRARLQEEEGTQAAFDPPAVPEIRERWRSARPSVESWLLISRDRTFPGHFEHVHALPPSFKKKKKSKYERVLEYLLKCALIGQISTRCSTPSSPSALFVVPTHTA
jgi:hypothetical protein